MVAPRSGSIGFEEFVGLLDQVLRGPVHHLRPGRTTAPSGAPNHPGCVQQPRVPFAIAATGAEGCASRRARRVWVTNGLRSHDRPAAARRPRAWRWSRAQMQRLDAACADGRAGPGARCAASCSPDRGSTPAWTRSTPGERHKRAYEEVGATDLVVHWPRPTEPYQGDPAILEHLVD